MFMKKMRVESVREVAVAVVASKMCGEDEKKKNLFNATLPAQLCWLLT